MSNRKRTDYYTFLYRTTPNVDRIRKYGGIVYHIGSYNAMVTAIISSKKQLNEILKDPNLVVAEEDCKIALPYPRIKNIFPAKTYHANSQSSLVANRMTWNIARVLGGRTRPNNGERIKVGILDTGIDLNHPDLAANVKGGINIVNPSAPPQDDNGHGTHVSGVIGAVNNHKGIVGVAPAVSLYAIKVLDRNGTGTLTTLVKGIEWCIRNKMNILNISISGGEKVPSIMAEVIKSATQKGIMVVASAGNSGNASGKGDNVQVPARLPDTVAVAALNRSNKRAPFSSTGPTVDIAAPGVHILSTYKDGQYATLSGTSMAAPHVSGTAAILMRTFPHVSPLHIGRLLKKNAIDLALRGMDRFTGAGLVQVR